MSDAYQVYQLRAMARLNLLISVFIDPENPDDYVAGYARAITSRQVLMLAVSPFGRYDGYVVLRLADMSMVLGEDDYAMRLKRLLLARGEQEPEAVDIQENEDLVHALCRHAQKNDRVITLWTSDAEYCGKVESLDDMRVTIGALDFYGLHPMSITLVLRDVEMASFDAEDDLAANLLFSRPDLDWTKE